MGRSTQGVKLMDLDPGDRLVAVASLAEEEKLEGDGEGGPGPEEISGSSAVDTVDVDGGGVTDDTADSSASPDPDAGGDDDQTVN